MSCSQFGGRLRCDGLIPVPFGTSPDLIFHELWGRAARLAGVGEKHRCGDGASLIGPATERTGQNMGCPHNGHKRARALHPRYMPVLCRAFSTQPIGATATQPCGLDCYLSKSSILEKI